MIDTAAVNQMIVRLRLARRATAGGKSELRRAVRRVTPGQGNLKESGTENTPPAFALGASRLELRQGTLDTMCRACRAVARSPKGGGRRRVRVKRCGKSAPRSWQHGWQAKPRTEQGQIGKRDQNGSFEASG